MNLKNLRTKIDKIDAQVVALLNARADVSRRIGRQKLKNNQGVYVPHREKEVFDHVRQANKGPMTDDALKAVYREIMSGSMALEKPLKIANLGTQGSFSSIAARRRFGSQIAYVPCKNIPDVFQSIETGECDYGIVPIENSTEGAVTHTYDALIDTELKICSQVLVRIAHCLCAKASINAIKKVYSNPNVFGQCRNWLQAHLPNAGQIWVPSTTEAVMIAKKEKNGAAIASKEAAELYHLPVLKENIQDIVHNTTRFLIIGKVDAAPTGQDRTSILFSVKHQVGALYHMLKPFYENRINLTKIESRPSKKKAWEYLFFVDLEGHRLDPKVKKALAQLEGMCKYLKILGSYPVLE
jgi:chorismate mutase / prephenate dehydratase